MIVALAGRRIDAADANVARFPLENVALVETGLRDLFRERGARAVVSSAACGADLVAQRVARSLALHRVVVLPFPPAIFRERSVVDRPGDWGSEFDDLLADARIGNAMVLELESMPSADETEAYRKANDAILTSAAMLARQLNEPVLPVLVWDGQSRGDDDLTVAFADSARERGLEPVSVPTL